MARVPYQPVPEVAPTGPAPAYLPAVAPPEAFGARVGGAAEKAGGEISQAGEQTFQTAAYLQQMKNATDALSTGTGFSTDLGNLETGFMQLSGNNAVNALPKFQKDVADLRDKWAGTLVSPAAQLAFDQEARSRMDRTLVNAGLHVAGEAKRAHVDALKASISNDRSLVVQDALAGRTPDFTSVIGKTGWLADELGEDDETKRSMVQEQVGNAMSDVIRGQIAKGNLKAAQTTFEGSLKMKVPGTDLPVMDGEHMSRLQYELFTAGLRADAQADRAAGTIRAGISRSLQNADALQKSGYAAPLPTDDQIDAAFPRDPDRADSVKESVADMRAINDYLPIVQSATPTQIADIETKLRPDPGKPDTFAHQVRLYNGFKAAMDTRQKMLGADPALYVLGGDKNIQALWGAADKDPSAFPAYAQAVLGAQVAMGVPAEAQHVLPVAVAKQYAVDLQSDPEHAQDKLRALNKSYAGEWGPMWKDIVTIGKLPVGFQAVEDIPDPLQASYLARALAPPKAEGKSIRDLVPKTMLSGNAGIDQIVEGHAQQFIHSLDGAGASDPMKAEMLDAMKRLAYANVVYGGAPDAATAAQKSIDAFTGHYTFLPNGGAMIPSASADAVTANMAVELQSLKDGDVRVPALYGQPGQPRQDEYLGLVKGAPTWKTAPDGGSALLYDPGGRLVRRSDGNPVSVRFDAPPPLSHVPVGMAPLVGP